MAYHRSGQWTNAVEAYNRALRFNRNLLEVRFNPGCLWLEQNNFEAAKADLFAYTSRRPDDGVGWVKLGTAQLRLRELGSAENSFREALRVDVRDVTAMNRLGLVFAQRNRSREAADSFAAAVNLQPNYRPALLNLATVLQQQLNDRAGAVRRYREYLVAAARRGLGNGQCHRAVAGRRVLRPSAQWRKVVPAQFQRLQTSLVR